MIKAKIEIIKDSAIYHWQPDRYYFFMYIDGLSGVSGINNYSSKSNARRAAIKLADKLNLDYKITKKSAGAQRSAGLTGYARHRKDFVNAM